MDATSVIAAFSEEQVERLTGLTRGQLRYWSATGFFAPALADDAGLPFSRLYSFVDVVALRTIGALRNSYNVPLQQLRKVAEKLSHLSQDLWVKTKLYVLNRRVIFEEPGSGRPVEIVSGQYVMAIPLSLVISDTRREVEALRARDVSKVGRVEQTRFVAHNEPVVAGTRIPTAAIRRFNEAGFTKKQILSEYPDLKPTDVEAALQYEAKRSSA